MKNKKIIWGLAIIAALLVIPTFASAATPIDEEYIMGKSFLSSSGVPMGVRQNNPGNLRVSGDNWQGLTARRSVNGFFEFRSWIWGVRAMIRTIKNYIRNGYNTPYKIIFRYCPPSDCSPGDPQGSQKYVDRVVAMTGLDPFAIISVTDRNSISKLVRAMAVVEVWAPGQYPNLIDLFADQNNIITEAEFNYAWDKLGA